MSFSAPFKVTLVAWTVLCVGCARLNESDSKPVSAPASISGTNFSVECVSHLGDSLTSYLDGKMSQAEVGATWDCLSHAVQTFNFYTSGADPGGAHSAQSLRSFFAHHFGVTDMSDSLLASLMEIKRVLLSGSNDRITPQELVRLQTLIGELKAVTSDLQPYILVLLNKQEHATDSEVEVAAVQLQKDLKRLGAWAMQWNQNYSFAQLTTLVSDLQSYGGKAAAPGNLNKALNLLPSVKAILAGGDKSQVSGQEWATVAKAIGHGYYFYLTLNYAFADRWDQALLHTSLVDGAKQLSDTLSEGVKRHPSQVITLDQWQDLFNAVATTQWLPDGMTGDALQQFWLWLLRRPLGDGVTPPTGLTAKNVQILHAQFNNWSDLLAGGNSNPLSAQLNQILAATAPMQWDSLGRILFAKQTPAQWSDDGRRRMIWPFVILNWLRAAFVGDAQIVTLEQMEKATGEVLPLLNNFGWFVTTKPTIGKRILHEADLFTQVANGDQQLDLNEAVHYLALVSSSVRAAQVWSDAATTSCGNTEPACLRQLPLKPGTNILTSLPRLQSRLTQWPQGQFITYMEHAETTSIGQIRTSEFGLGDLTLIWELFEYVEVFVQRYDTNFSETISLAESMASYPVFSPTLNQMIGGGSIAQPQLEVFYTFLFKFGDKPDQMFGGMVAYNWWTWHRELWAYESDRDILMSILSRLASSW